MFKLLALAGLFSATATFAEETKENFNSRKDVPIHNLKSKLQSSCWTFHHFDINANGWNPGIEGDGAMTASADAIKFNNSGIFTPVLNVSTDINISFEYIFNSNFSSGAKRWMKICLANANNEIIRVLETINFNGATATKLQEYNTSFQDINSGEYRLVLQYGGSGESATIAIDELKVSAPLKYEGGCNSSPVLLKAKVTGRPDRTAFGSLLLNDKDQNEEKLTAYLIKGSAHGEVTLNADGTFLFTPNKGFEGTSTGFVYKVCDAAGLCSANTTVKIDFPKASVSLVDFKGAYKYNGHVELMWNTATENNISKFELERSFDGHKWEKAGTVDNSPDANIYAYVDNVGKGTAHKKDIYYRLKQTNNDGSTLMSKLLIVRVYNTKTLTMISVTPDPAMNNIAANIQLVENSFVTMRILDKDGNTVIRRTAEGVPGLNSFAVDGSSDLTPGAYVLELIVNSKERMLVKLIKE